MTLNAIIDSILGVIIALVVVSRVVRKQWTTWLMSKDSEPYMDRVAERVIAKAPKVPSTEDFMEAIEPRITGLEARINEPIQIDLDPIIAKVTENVIAEVDKIRAVIDGKIGWMKKIELQTGNVIGEEAVKEAMETRGINPNGAQGRLYKRLKALMADSKWQKANPAAAAGVDAVLGEIEEGMNLTGGSSSTTTRATRRVGR